MNKLNNSKISIKKGIYLFLYLWSTKIAVILWNIKTKSKQKKVFSERLKREKPVLCKVGTTYSNQISQKI